MAFKTVFDRDFKYRNSVSTDVRLTFARIKRQQRERQPQAMDSRVPLILNAPRSARQEGRVPPEALK